MAVTEVGWLLSESDTVPALVSYRRMSPSPLTPTAAMVPSLFSATAVGAEAGWKRFVSLRSAGSQPTGGGVWRFSPGWAEISRLPSPEYATDSTLGRRGPTGISRENILPGSEYSTSVLV